MWLDLGFGFVIRFTGFLQTVTTINYRGTDNSLTLDSAVTHAKPSQSAVSSQSLLANGSQRCRFLSSHVHVLTGYRLPHSPTRPQLLIICCLDVSGQHWLPMATTQFRRCLKEKSKSKSELLYDWWFTANQFVLTSRHLRITTRDFFNWTLAAIAYVTSSLTRRCVCLLWICLAFVTCTFDAYGMLLNLLPFTLHTSSLSVKAFYSRLCLSYVSVSKQSQSQSYVRTDGQSASLSWYQATIWGIRPDFYSCGFVDVRRSLWRKNGSAVYNCCWSSPACLKAKVKVKSKLHCDWRSANQ
jgi:hypothetical protein